MRGAVYSILLILGICLTLFLTNEILSNCLSNSSNILNGLRPFTTKLFQGRNWFGCITSAIIFVIAIPAMMLIMLMQLGVWYIEFLIYIYCMGNKKE